MTQHPDLFAALAAPFDAHEVKVRTQAGRQMHYITARTAMNRLDAVLGPENWWDDYTPGEHSVLCRLSIRLPEGQILTKADAGGYAGMADEGDDDKSGYSDAFKRAAVKFGVGRYLYRDGVPRYRTPEPAREPGSDDEPPRAAAPPPVSRPEPPHQPPQGQRSQPQPPQRQHGDESDVPRTGKGLYAWTMAQQQRYEVGLLKYLNNWARLQDYPARMVDWNTEQVSLAHAEACRKLQAMTDRNDAREEALAN